LKQQYFLASLILDKERSFTPATMAVQGAGEDGSRPVDDGRGTGDGDGEGNRWMPSSPVTLMAATLGDGSEGMVSGFFLFFFCSWQRSIYACICRIFHSG